MPGLVKKLLICAAVDGLLLQPVTSDKSFGGDAVKIEYGSRKPRSIKKQDDVESQTKLEVHGIIGVLDLVSSSYLISITKREQVAQIRGHPIYAIRDVALIPLSSKSAAEQAIAASKRLSAAESANVLAAGVGEHTDESDIGEDAETASLGGEEDHVRKGPESEAAALEVPKSALKQSATYIKNAVQEGAKPKTFAERWFSRGTRTTKATSDQSTESEGVGSKDSLTAEQQKQAAQDLPDQDADASQLERDVQQDAAPGESSINKRRAVETLNPRILRTARLYFGSSGFYFSYEHNLSKSLGRHDEDASQSSLWKRFDSPFFWNRHLLTPFIDEGQEAYTLPILQGFVGQREFSLARVEGQDKKKAKIVEEGEAPVTTEDSAADDIPSGTSNPAVSNLLLTLISRRSIQRAGLRYLRRGVDNDGNVANSVETEQILSSQAWSASEKEFSLTQIRGSIPLFFSQTPYSFKPIPTMLGSEATNRAAFAKHMTLLHQRYGRVQMASLVDKHGTEASIGEAYEKQAKSFNDEGGIDGSKVGFEWFDFHSACKGMNFKNVSILLDTLQDPLNSIGWLVKQGDETLWEQSGVLRTNCMDCLDRTNVTQSAIAGWALERQLSELNLSIDLQTDPGTQWFNVLWADNGDAISKQYAGTSALKGDFTRTRKRNWKGALSDFSLTLNRFYYGIISDYFMQTCIDYYLGNAGPAIFDEFETDMMAQDYAFDMSHIRQNAIDTCIKMVLEDPQEKLLGGWTLSCPQEANTLRTLPFEECVLLLTSAAVYFCRFDWSSEKVGSFERVDLRDITQIWHGSYITSTLGAAHLDPAKNVGFAIRFNTGGPAVIRTNTRSLQNEQVPVAEASAADEQTSEQQPASNETSTKATKGSDGAKTRLLAFKVLPPKAMAAKNKQSGGQEHNEVEIARAVCSEIRKAADSATKQDGSSETTLVVEERDVISATDARKNTGYVESLGYSLKRLVWS